MSIAGGLARTRRLSRQSQQPARLVPRTALGRTPRLRPSVSAPAGGRAGERAGGRAGRQAGAQPARRERRASAEAAARRSWDPPADSARHARRLRPCPSALQRLPHSLLSLAGSESSRVQPWDVRRAVPRGPYVCFIAVGLANLLHLD